MKTRISVLLFATLLCTKAFSQNPGQGNAAWKVDGNMPTSGDFVGAVNYMPLLFKTNDIERMRITEDGLIGIGNVTPTVALDIIGNLKLSGSANIGGDLSLGGTLKVDSIEAKTPGRDITINSSTSFLKNVYVNTRLGIGTKLPVVELDIVGDANVSNNGRFGNNLRVLNQVYSDKFGAQTSGGDISFYSKSIFNRDLSVSLNTGLGVLNPTERLDIDGNIKLTGSSYVGNTLFANKISPISGTSIMTTAGTNYFTGKMGIGVSNPVEKLEVNGHIVNTGQIRTGVGILFPDKTAQITAYDPTSTVGAAQIEVENYIKLDNALYLVAPNTNISGASAGNNYEFYTDDNRDLYLQSKSTSGSIVVGRQKITAGTHADFKFAVDGKAVFKHAVVTTDNWADYVFDEDYELAKLDDVKLYISENGHLPNVPSKNEVVTNGIDVAQMDAILLRKIEELTLYMIKLSEENEILKNEVNILKQR
jgi:hypothetical protein